MNLSALAHTVGDVFVIARFEVSTCIWELSVSRALFAYSSAASTSASWTYSRFAKHALEVMVCSLIPWDFFGVLSPLTDVYVSFCYSSKQAEFSMSVCDLIVVRI